MFKTRLVSSMVILLITLVSVITGGNVAFVYTLTISLVGTMELLRMAKVRKTPFEMIAYVAVLALYTLLYFGQAELLLPLAVLYLLAVMTAYVAAFPKYQAEQVLYTFFGLFYVGLMLSYIYQARMLPKHGAYAVWLIFIAAWGSDTCAYCAGILFGKHKAAPKLSPKKTWEGCIGGVVGAALLAYFYGLAMNGIFVQTEVPPLEYAVICGCAAILSQFGDLAASALKRNNGIKDYGRLIPGHGGILDRFDSIIFVAPVVYYGCYFLLAGQ